MLKCKVCGKELIKNQKSTCSWECRAKYVNKLNTGRPSPFKGKKGRWTEEQKKKIGAAGKGRKMSEENRKKQSERMAGIAFFKGKKHTDEWKKNMRGENSSNWKGGRKAYMRRQILRRYKMTIEDYDNMFEKQGGVCAICGKPEIVKNYLSVDHDHSCCEGKNSCGKCVRGLLCSRCNQAIGLLNDSEKNLKSAIKYLKNYELSK